MNVLAICGAANKRRNTATMLENALEGALSVAESEGEISGEIVYLYDLAYHGCTGCHSCKLLQDGKFGHCALRDELTPVLSKAINADVLLIGSPIYYSDVTGATRAFLERYLFPGMTYNKERFSLYPKRTKVGWVLTMNAPESSYAKFAADLVALTSRLIGPSDCVMACQTQQFEDYSLYAATQFDEAAIRQRHLERFPQDCHTAYIMGKTLASDAMAGAH
ncbi:MAG: flavodoxin family protein [Actinomycetia bacterium]|nr:flavodoxin family protein [Actinomycetes bacterium]